MVESVDKSEVKNVIDFLENKINWLKSHNKNQWCSLDYLAQYDFNYFCESIDNGDILLVDKEDGLIKGCLLLKKKGHYVKEYTSKGTALYILHFASSGLKSGRRLIKKCVEIARELGVDYLRGDANIDFENLVGYYTRLGAKIVKECDFYNGAYRCALLEYKV